MTMENETATYSGIVSWIAKLTRKIVSGKIVPMYYGENLPPSSHRLRPRMRERYG